MDYELGWCHQCCTAIVACCIPNCNCGATTCNAGGCPHQDLYAIADTLDIKNIPFKDYEHQSLDHLEGKPLISIAKEFAHAAHKGIYGVDPTHTHACAIIVYIAISLMESGETLWSFQKAKKYASIDDGKYVHMLSACDPYHPNKNAKNHYDDKYQEVIGTCPNCGSKTESPEKHSNES